MRVPAGWGKSTLMAMWQASGVEGRPFAWLALDEQDNDPVQFWTYVIEALRTVVPTLGENYRVLARTPGLRHAAVTVRVLLNERIWHSAIPSATTLGLTRSSLKTCE